MEELLRGISSLSYWDVFADMHGLLAMLLLVLFGTTLVLYFALDKFAQALVANLVLLDVMGIYIYGAYRATDGPRTLLNSSPDTAWLHQIIFEHKEMLAYAPWLIVLVALSIVATLGDRLKSQESRALRLIVLFSIVASLAFVLVIAGEAVLVTKAAPLR